MANDGFSRGWLLAILGLLIAQAVFVIIITSEDAPRIEMEGANTPVVDEQGRYIIFVGEVELRIPDEILHMTYRQVESYEIFELGFCWPRVQTNERCSDFRTRIRVHLLAQSASHEFPFNDGDSKIARITEPYGEPVEMANPLVKKYEFRPGRGAAYFVIMRLRESGHYPLASCFGSTCKVGYTPQPGLRVTYEFAQSHADDWQIIDDFITGHIDDFIFEN